MTATVTEEEPIRLSDEQKKVLRIVRSGKNVFFTGPAGTGKSVLLREIIKDFRERVRPSHIAITASTGMAGVNVGGTTLHSFAGAGLAKDNVEHLVAKMTKFAQKRWQRTQVLVIDEISMVDGAFFDKLEEIARLVRESDMPFGGIQLVICGDFFQLPPVPENTYEGEAISTFAFEAKSWGKCIPKPIFLSQVFRQKDDKFVDILTGLRHGNLKDSHIRQLEKLDRPLVYNDGIDPIEMLSFPVKSEVDKCNSKKLAPLPGPQHVYMSMDSVGYDVFGAPIEVDSAYALLDRLISVPFLSLKVGAQVMLIQNCVLNQGEEKEIHMVNGSLGKVIEFITKEEAYLRKRAEEEPSKLEVIEPRPTSSSRTSMSSTRPLNGHEFSRRQVWPLVLFENGQELLCPASIFTVEGFTGNVEAMRVQVPLILAWAISVHKSQGQTLNRAKVDLGKTFETGQAYVAISRVTSMDGLELTNFHPSKIRAHPRVVSWSRACSFGSGDLSDDSDLDDIE